MRKRNKQDKSEKGTLEFALGNLFKCVCCIHSGITYEEKRLNEINESLQQINKRLNLLDRFDGFIIYSHYEISTFNIFFIFIFTFHQSIITKDSSYTHNYLFFLFLWFVSCNIDI